MESVEGRHDTTASLQADHETSLTLCVLLWSAYPLLMWNHTQRPPNRHGHLPNTRLGRGGVRPVGRDEMKKGENDSKSSANRPTPGSPQTCQA